MEPIKQPKTFNVYQLIKQSGMYLSAAGSGTSNIGIGFYMTLTDAEHQRTMELLKDTAGSQFHIYELVIPNPAYKE